MSCPASQNFCIAQGSTWSQTLIWKTGTPAVAVNITGYTARMQARARVTDAAPVISLTTENGGIALGGSAGTITLTLSAAATALLNAGRYVYDLELISGSGIVRRLIEGTITVSAEVTR